MSNSLLRLAVTVVVALAVCSAFLNDRSWTVKALTLVCLVIVAGLWVIGWLRERRER